MLDTYHLFHHWQLINVKQIWARLSIKRINISLPLSFLFFLYTFSSCIDFSLQKEINPPRLTLLVSFALKEMMVIWRSRSTSVIITRARDAWRSIWRRIWRVVQISCVIMKQFHVHSINAIKSIVLVLLLTWLCLRMKKQLHGGERWSKRLAQKTWYIDIQCTITITSTYI